MIIRDADCYWIVYIKYIYYIYICVFIYREIIGIDNLQYTYCNELYVHTNTSIQTHDCIVFPQSFLNYMCLLPPIFIILALRDTINARMKTFHNDSFVLSYITQITVSE